MKLTPIWTYAIIPDNARSMAQILPGRCWASQEECMKEALRAINDRIEEYNADVDDIVDAEHDAGEDDWTEEDDITMYMRSDRLGETYLIFEMALES